MAGNDVVVIPDMDELTSAQMLRKALISPVPADFEERVPELLTRLTFLPLAIVQAAPYINTNSVLVADYLSLLGQSDDEVVDLLSEHFEDEGRYAEAKNPIATTWLISFEHIRHTDPLVAEYLSFMACLEPKSISQSLLPKAHSLKKLLDSVGTLSAYCFVTRRPDGKFYDMHRLVHLASRNWLAKERQLEYWKRKVLAQLARVFPNDAPQNRELWRNYSPHARYVLEQSAMEQLDNDYCHSSVRYGHCLYRDGRYAESELYFLRVFTRNSELLGLEHPDTLTSMANFASTYLHKER
jgi:hypothetical protein